MHMARAMALLKAYLNEEIPLNGGFIITAFFDPSTIYAIYEATAYKNVKDIYESPEGLTFKTDGNRTNMLVEHPTYAQRFTEPIHREKGRSIPYRFSECHMLTGPKQEKIMIAKEPVMLHSVFTILKTGGDNFSFIFYPTEDVYMAIKRFMADSLYNDCGLNKKISLEAAQIFLESVKKFTVWAS
jgi:hypothetical protein